MIFVTVGGMRPFDRLIMEMDGIAGSTDEKVVMQIGSTKHQPRNCNYFRFMPRNDIEELYAGARVVVCHAGTGSILTAAKYNRPLVLVPRLRRYGEVFDDHQLEMARMLESEGLTVVYDINGLRSAIGNVSMSVPKLGGGRNLAGALKEYLDQLEKQLGRL